MPDVAPKVKANLDFLHKQVGPLPVGGWLIVVGAGLAFSYWRKRQTTTTTNSNDQLTPQFTDETVGNVFSLIGALNKGQSGIPTQTITDNNTWYQSAVRNLLGFGFVPGLVDTALRKYMQGMTLTKEENAVVERALQVVGPLPSPPPPPSTEPIVDVQPKDFRAGSNNPFLGPVTGQSNMIPLYGNLNPSKPGAEIIGYIPFGTQLSAIGQEITQLWGSSHPSELQGIANIPATTNNRLLPVAYNGKTGYVAESDVTYGS